MLWWPRQCAFKNWSRNRLLTLIEKPLLDPIYIGLFGSTGAGKSSLINAIIQQAMFLPVSGESICTSCIVQVSSGCCEQYEAKIHLLSDQVSVSLLLFFLHPSFLSPSPPSFSFLPSPSLLEINIIFLVNIAYVFSEWKEHSTEWESGIEQDGASGLYPVTTYYETLLQNKGTGVNEPLLDYVILDFLNTQPRCPPQGQWTSPVFSVFHICVMTGLALLCSAGVEGGAEELD